MIGGARRVGRAISLGLAEAGADVALTAHSSTGDGEATAQAIRALGRRSVALACDVRSTAEIDRAVGAAAEELDGLDVLVYAAGAAFRGVAPEKVDLELFDEAIETILQGAFFAAQSAHQRMQESGGVIVFITDVAGIQPWPSFVPHSVAKAGLIHLTRVLAKAWAPSIRVCGVAPGTVLMEEGSSADSIAERRARRGARARGHARRRGRGRALPRRGRLRHRRPAHRRRRPAALSVDAYIAEAPAERREALALLHRLCREELAGFDEGLRHGMPCYLRDDVVRGRIRKPEGVHLAVRSPPRGPRGQQRAAQRPLGRQGLHPLPPTRAGRRDRGTSAAAVDGVGHRSRLLSGRPGRLDSSA